MIFDFSKMSSGDAYRFLTAAVTPRPIAWVSTLSPRGIGNLAPFSFFNAVCSNPPTLVFSCARNSNGSKKDTLINIEATGEFVVNVPSEDLVSQVDETSESHPYEVDELKLEGLTALPSSIIKPVRVGECKIQMECKLLQTVEIGNGDSGSTTLVIGQIVYAHVDDSLIDEKGRINFVKVKPLSRLGGRAYGKAPTAFEIE